MIVPILFICYVLFLNPEIILEEQCPNKPYSLTIVKHGTGIFDKKIVLIYYKINGKTVAVGNLVFFENFGRDIDITWDTNTDDGALKRKIKKLEDDNKQLRGQLKVA